MDQQTPVRCPQCRTTKPRSEFYSLRSGRRSSACKDCSRARRKEWGQRNKDRVRDLNARWREENRGRRKSYQRRYYQQNRARLLEQKREYHQRVLSDPNLLARKQRARKRAEEKLKMTAPERYKVLRAVKNLRSRRRVYNLPVRGRLTFRAAWQRILYYGRKCWLCGAPWEHLDHVIPVGQGGSDWPANIRPACAKCNLTRPRAKRP